jgi:hypothetical protein
MIGHPGQRLDERRIDLGNNQVVDVIALPPLRARPRPRAHAEVGHRAAPGAAQRQPVHEATRATLRR